MAEESVGQRFSQLIQQLGMSKNAFAMSLDKTATVIQHLVDERNKPGFDLMCKVFEVYPNVSRDWLLLGNGPMLLQEAPVPVPPPTAAAPVSAPGLVAVAPALAPPATPSFPAPLFTVSAARPAAPEALAPPAAPVVAAPPPVPPVAGPPQAVPPASAPPLASQLPAAIPSSAATPDATALTAALHTQYLQHQLALAEQRNQHLVAQQALMQQMLDLLRRPV